MVRMWFCDLNFFFNYEEPNRVTMAARSGKMMPTLLTEIKASLQRKILNI